MLEVAVFEPVLVAEDKVGTGAGSELQTNRVGSLLTIACSIAATLVVWAILVATGKIF